MVDNIDDGAAQTRLISITTEIVAAYASHNSMRGDDLNKLISSVHSALSALSNPSTPVEAEPQEPAVPPKKSVRGDHIVCLEDGKKFKSLKRHLQTDHGMTPDEYRAKWSLPRDYPMVAPEYAAARSELAKKSGLGVKRATTVARKRK